MLVDVHHCGDVTYVCMHCHLPHAVHRCGDVFHVFLHCHLLYHTHTLHVVRDFDTTQSYSNEARTHHGKCTWADGIGTTGRSLKGHSATFTNSWCCLDLWSACGHVSAQLVGRSGGSAGAGGSARPPIEPLLGFPAWQRLQRRRLLRRWRQWRQQRQLPLQQRDVCDSSTVHGAAPIPPHTARPLACVSLPQPDRRAPAPSHPCTAVVCESPHSTVQTPASHRDGVPCWSLPQAPGV